MIQTAAKGFIALGLRENHAVAIMAANCPEWFTSIYATIFAGGIPCGIYTTSSPDIASYICANASADILLLEDINMLTEVMSGRENLSEAFPELKYAVLINSSDDDIKRGK